MSQNSDETKVESQDWDESSYTASESAEGNESDSEEGTEDEFSYDESKDGDKSFVMDKRDVESQDGDWLEDEVSSILIL